jgi:RimJ/RimL family protein N-acetyltransferase
VEAFDTARLRLRPLDGRDEALYRGIYTDPLVMRHVAAPLSASEACSSFTIACRHNAAACGREWWVCVERVGRRSIGIVGMTRRNDRDDGTEEHGIEIGVLLLPAWQRRGFAAEAIAALIERTVQHQPTAVLWLHHAAGNTAMRRLARSLGFQLEVDGSAGVCWQWRRDRQSTMRHGT